MTRRGMTLLEMLFALALLSGIVIGATAWGRATAARLDAERARQAWTACASALLRSIETDVAVADLDPIGDRARGIERVATDEATLTIRTRERHRGVVVRAYAFDPDAGTVSVRTTAAGAVVAADTALGDVRMVTFGIHDQHLEVNLRHEDGTTLATSIALQAEGGS